LYRSKCAYSARLKGLGSPCHWRSVSATASRILSDRRGSHSQSSISNFLCVHVFMLQVYHVFNGAVKCMQGISQPKNAPAHIFSAHTAPRMCAWTGTVDTPCHSQHKSYMFYMCYKFYYDLTHSEISKKFSRDVPPPSCERILFLRRTSIIHILQQTEQREQRE
jgi:hypothetical protein